MRLSEKKPVSSPRGSAKPVVNFTECRKRLLDSIKPHRKSGYVLGYFQPSLRD
jgi:hypothetical protein